MGGPSFGNTGAEPRAPTTTTTAHGSRHASGCAQGGPPVAFDELEPPPLVQATGEAFAPVVKTLVRCNPLTTGHRDHTDVRAVTSAPGAPAASRSQEASWFSKPEPPTQPQTWLDDAEGGTAVYRARGSGAPGSAVGFRPPGIPITVDERGSTEAVTIGLGTVATIIGAYLSDDEDGRTICVPDGEPLELGRRPDSPFFDDPFVERRHAALTATPSGVRVDDFSGDNGVYRRIEPRAPLRDGDLLIIGRQVLRFALLPQTAPGVLSCPNPGWWGRLDAMIGAEAHAASYPLRLPDTIVGSGPEATVRFDPSMGIVDRHCRIHREADGATFIEDLGTEPGTFVRVRSSEVVPHECQLLVGRTLLRLERVGGDL